ncbi:retrovirus-related pol polyprotein from transposon TNT 1-94 [Tanacetum coccineum]
MSLFLPHFLLPLFSALASSSNFTNHRNQATIQDGRVTVQTVQERQTQGYANNRAMNNATNQGANRNEAAGQAMMVKCYNCQEEGHFARQCTKPKRPKNSTWFKEKMLLTEASFQTDDLDAFDSDCNERPQLRQFSWPIFPPMTQMLFQRNRIGSWRVEHIKVAFEKDVKPFAQTLKEYFLMFEHGLYKELKDMKAVFNKIETEVAKCSVDKKYFEIQKKELILENDRLLEHIIYQDVMNVVMHADVHNVLSVYNNRLDKDNLSLESLKIENDRLMELLISQDLVHTHVNALAAINDYKSMKQSFMDEYKENLKLQTELATKNDMEFFQINELQAHLEAKNVSIAKLKEHIANLKGKNVVDSVQTVHNSNVVTSKLYKVDLQPLSPCIKNNRDAHVDYLKVTQEDTDTLQGIVEQAKALKPLDNALDYSCKYAQRIQELLVYVCASCPSSKYVSGKLVVVTPMNRTRKVSNANVKHSVLNVNSELICATCNECMFDAIHDLCVLDYLNDVNARVKSKSVKSRSAKSKKKKMWKPTGHTNRTLVPGLGLLQAYDWASLSAHQLRADLISGLRDTNLYTISLDDMLKSSPICLPSKASKTKSWLWHRQLSHLNFDTLNQLAKQGLVRGLPKLKFEKDHLCSACSLGKSKKNSHKPKAEDTNQEKLNLLHMDLCVPMRVESINGKKYILVIVDDYSRFMWVKFLRSKDETPEVIITFLKQIQVRLNATVRNVQTDNGTEFVN